MKSKPLYKKWWFWVIIGIVAVVIFAPKDTSNNQANMKSQAEISTVKTNNNESSTDSTIEYIHYNVVDLFDELSDNALKAERKHKDEYVEIEGYLHVIDSDGKYVSVGSDEKHYSHMFDSVSCYIKNEEQRQIIIDMSKYDKLVVRGKIKSIGEIIGYSIDIDSIEKIK